LFLALNLAGGFEFGAMGGGTVEGDTLIEFLGDFVVVTVFVDVEVGDWLVDCLDLFVFVDVFAVVFRVEGSAFGAIDIKNTGNEELVLSSWQVVNNSVKPGTYCVLEPGKSQRFQFCKEWILSVSHVNVEVLDFVAQGEKYNSECDLLNMASKY